MGRPWRIDKGPDGALILSRPGLTRMDICAEARFPPLRRAALAHEIRKDIWRALQGLRGFSPIVHVIEEPGGLRVVAGGQVSARPYPKERSESCLAALLSAPGRRQRWIHHARLR